jgi:hypothetical protein
LNRQHSNRAPPVSGFSSSPAFPRLTSRARPPASAGCQPPPFFLYHTPSRAPILFLSHSPLRLKATKRTRRPPECKAAAASSSHWSSLDFTTPRHLFQSRSRDHLKHRRAPLLAPSLPELHRRVGPSSTSSSPRLASTRAGAVHRAGHNCCSPPSTDSIPGFFIPR